MNLTGKGDKGVCFFRDVKKPGLRFKLFFLSYSFYRKTINQSKRKCLLLSYLVAMNITRLLVLIAEKCKWPTENKTSL